MKKEYDFSSGKRGAVAPVLPGKTRVTIPLDDDVLGLVSLPDSRNGRRQLSESHQRCPTRVYSTAQGTVGENATTCDTGRNWHTCMT